MTPTMHGRDAEQHLLYSLLNEIRSRALVLVLDGRAGIGKTTLWQAAQAVARERSYRVLATRAVEAEATLPFTGLVDLLQRVADDHLAELPVPQQRALEIALLRREPTELPVDRLAVSLAVLAVLRSIARTTPAIIAVDDLQWLDRPSARVLAFALRRLNEEPVGLLATLRSEVEGPLPLGLDQAIPASRLRRIALDGLPVGALDQVLRDRLGLDLARTTLVRLHQVTGGNPFYALELASSLPVPPN
jgi:predicted ATPase